MNFVWRIQLFKNYLDVSYYPGGLPLVGNKYCDKVKFWEIGFPENTYFEVFWV